MSKKESELILYTDYNTRINKFNKFVYAKDLKHTLKHYKLDNLGKKDILQQRLLEFYNKLHHYEKFNDEIIKIQSIFKGINTRKKMLSRGPGFLNKKLCNNDEDFFTFENKHEILDDYFFSYKDTDNFIYFYDIRSLKKLIGNNPTPKNPYNMIPIPEYAINAMNSRIKEMNLKKIDVEHEKPILTPQQEYNNKVLTIFQKIDLLNAFAGGTDVNWFHNLSFKEVKDYYKILEDIWNYRSELNEKQKREIVPHNDIFKYSMAKLMNLPIKFEKKMRNLVLDEIDKLISSSPSKTHRNTGCYYVLIAFVEVSPECAGQMPWLIQAN